nr:probable GMP synthase [glutamine-hydrolyzing] [Ipomoea batatas]GMD38828.1 probable GMP synthase [glutamine-hydrolyzing] [Ipomoea batatas]GMD38829.1 probable GMP synthase [glutamine-hydrolyzing] [Ipomoea batatas]
MSRVKSMNHADPELRPVLGPAGNKARSVELRKPVEKLKAAANKAEKPAGGVEKKFQAMPMESRSPEKKCGSVGSILRQQQEHRSFLMRSNLWMNASCSSDASSDSFQSRASTGRVSRRSVTPSSARRKQCSSKVEKIDKVASEAESLSVSSEDASVVKKRCSWVTSNTDPLYSTFHDEEWGVPVHDDRMLFELLSLCTALAELTWPAILSRRQTFRKMEKFPLLNRAKTAHVMQIIDELGSFNKYIWDFVNKKPVVNNFRYPRQVPIKTSKAEMISKDLVRRGFRGVGPTVVYSFMQVAGITNDHLVSCFRFHHCIAAADASNTGNSLRVVEAHVKHLEDETELGLVRAIDDLNLSS